MANVRVEKEGAVVRLILSRPDKHNILNRAIFAELSAQLDEIAEQAAEDNIRVLVLAGEGPVFCAGQDLLEEEATKDGNALRNLAERSINPVIRQLRALSLPVIASVTGVAAGAGITLALACDLIIADEEAKFLPAFGKLGLSPVGGASYFLPRFLGHARALGVCLTGEPITGKQAEEWGLIWKAVPIADHSRFVQDLAVQLAQAPTFAMAQIKEAINASFHHSLENQLRFETELLARTGDSEDYREGRNAFIEKRPAKFWGR